MYLLFIKHWFATIAAALLYFPMISRTHTHNTLRRHFTDFLSIVCVCACICFYYNFALLWRVCACLLFLLSPKCLFVYLICLIVVVCKFFFCSGKERNLNILELLCATCYRWFHESCIGFQMGKLIPFSTNYIFFCKNCSNTGLESFRKCQASKLISHTQNHTQNFIWKTVLTHSHSPISLVFLNWMFFCLVLFFT